MMFLPFEKSSTDCINKILREAYQTRFERFYDRCKFCIDTEEGYFEFKKRKEKNSYPSYFRT